MKHTITLTFCALLIFCGCKKEISSNASTVSNSASSDALGSSSRAMLISSGDKTVTFLDAVTGKEIYFNQRLINNSGLMVSQTPLVMGNLCILFLGSELWAVNMQTQERLWAITIGKTISQYGYYRSSPAYIADSTIYFTNKRYGSNANVTSNDFFSVDLRNGHINWQVPLNLFYDNDSPVQVPVCNNAYAYVVVYNTLYAYNRATGALAWSMQRGFKFMRNPCIAGNKIFIAADVNALYSDSLFAVDANNGAVLWAHDYASLYAFGANPAPVAVHEKVFINMSDGISCLDANNGNEVWRCRTGNPMLPVFYDNDMLYASSEYNTNAYAVHAEDGSLVWSSKTGLSSGVSNLEEGPLVIDDMMYLRNDYYFAFNKNTGAIVWSTVLHNGLYVNPPYTPNATNSNGVPVFYSAAGMR